MANQLYTIILRHDTSTNWVINNPVLALGEYGVEDDTHRIKRGDGESDWNSLLYETFGIELSVSFSDITGEPTDNKKLTTALDSKMDEAVFEEVGNRVVSDIQLKEEDNIICNLSKSTIDVTGESSKVPGVNTNVLETNIYIQSDDNSIQGVWRATAAGIKVLNLTSNLTVEDFKPTHGYKKNQLCVYNNKIYRAIEDFTSESRFYDDEWTLLTSLEASDISYNNTTSELTATTVQECIDELDTNIKGVRTNLEDLAEQVQDLDNIMTYTDYD